MPEVIFLGPLDQPSGKQRLADWLREGMRSERFQAIKVVVGFTKYGALARLKEVFESFRSKGGSIKAVFGVDLKGTSKQALSFALGNFDTTYVWHHPSVFITFHPKIYILEGTRHAEICIGSGNFTVGGTETNAEAAVKMRYSLPDENTEWKEITAFWSPLLEHPNTKTLNLELLAALDTAGLLLDEGLASTLKPSAALKKADATGPAKVLFPFTPVQPASHLPGVVRQSAKPKPSRKPMSPSLFRSTAPVASTSLPDALLIQIVPHHNGEIFLSKRAVDQQPAFFGYPFSGKTVPKKSGNTPYPQRVPDPITHWTIYDKTGQPAVVLKKFALNTVMYDKKGEIRITVPPEVGKAIPPLSILQMACAPEDSGLDYVCDVFAPNSEEYKKLIVACTEIMPSGGASHPRRFGWI